MNKWADYLISAVKYNGDRTKIEGVRCYIDKGDSISEPVDVSRRKVLYLLESGYTITAIFKNVEGKWQEEAPLRLVEIEGEKFIRTDRNVRRCDKLVNLPEF